MFERFTELAVKTIMLAQQSVSNAKRGEVHPADLLLGLCALEGSLIDDALATQGLSKASVEVEVRKFLPSGDHPKYPELPFTDGSKRCLELCWDEARKLESKPINEAHILLGVLRAQDEVVQKVLSNLEVDSELLRDEATSMSGPRG